MHQASSFTPITPHERLPAPGGWRASLFAALDGAAFTIPLSLGSVTLVFSKVGGAAMASAVFATLLVIALLQLTTARASRPLLYSARFFEATTLAAMLDRAIELLPAWGVTDTPQMRLAILCTVMAGAGLVVGALFVLRADRFSRHIPTPVFAAFSNSIAFGLLLSQAGTLRSLLAGDGVLPSLFLAAAAFAVGAAVRHWLPRWPAAACALAAGLGLGGLLHFLGSPVAMLGTPGSGWSLPGTSADFGALAAALPGSAAMTTWLALNIAILGTMMFINTSITAQAVSHADDRPREGLPRQLWTSGLLIAAGAAGAAPLSASLQSANAAMRHAPLAAPVLLLSAVAIAAVAASGVLALVPVAAVAGALVCEAVYMVDRPSIRLLRSWAASHKLSRQQREDLALVALVTGTAVFVNMVAAVLAGLLLGLLLFASRHIIPPVRATWDGTQVASNCARSRSDVQLLAARGHELRVIELQGDLFFGTVDALDRALRAAVRESRCIVLDWSRVRHIDTSAIQAVAKCRRAAHAAAVAMFHVDPALSSADLAATLGAVLPADAIAPDLDRALERAETHLLQGAQRAPGTTALEAMSLLAGLDEAERNTLELAMNQRVVAPGGVVVQAGDPGDDLMIMLEGSASVLVPDGAGHMMRVAGLRRGALIGEIAFFDSAPRSATVIANEQVLVAVLGRADYERLGTSHPRLVQKLLANISVYLATRLRHTTALAAARLARGRA